MAKVKTNNQSVRRFLHNNAATIAAILLFVVILATFIIARYNSLYSIRDIANINPLITTENAELIAVNVNGVIKIIKDDDSSANDSNKKSENSPNKEVASNQQSNSSPNPSSGSSGGTPKPSSTSTPSSTPSPSSSPSSTPIISIPPILSPSPTATPPPSEFRVSIQSKGRTNQRVYDVGFLRFYCKNDSTLQVKVKATNGSGSAKVLWKFDGDVVKTDSDSLKNMSSGDTRTSETIVTTESFGIYSITADIVNANGATLASTDITFSHSCV